MTDEFTKECIAKAKEIEAQIKPLRDKIGILADEYRTIRGKVVDHLWKVKVGSIVKDRTGKLHKVTEVRVFCGDQIESAIKDRPWVKGCPIRKDGTYGSGERYLYENWEAVEE